MKKLKIILPYFITLIVGVGLGFSIPIIMGTLGDDFTIAKSYETKNALKQTGKEFLTSTRIDYATAYAMVNKYRGQNDKAWFRRLRTDAGESLHGFWIPKSLLCTILDQKGANGLRIYLGKRADINGKKRIFSLVLLGTSGSENNFLGTDNNTDMTLATNYIYDHVDPCPQACGSLGGN